MIQYVRKILLNIPPYIPGRSIESIQKEYGISKIYKLASNENPLGPSPKAIKAIRQYLKNIHRYPDPDANRLKNKLAEKLNLAHDNFLIGNGAAEIIDLIALAFIDPQDEVLLSYPTFPKYALSARRVMGKVITIEMKNFQHDHHAILNRISSKTKLIFIDTPSNPVGCKLSRAEQQFILDNLPDHVVLVLDEAYREFIDEHDCLNYHDVLPDRKNVLFLRTLSKGYGLSGLRIGYLIGHPETIADVNRVREVFNVNSLALVAAEAALDDDEHLQRTIEANEKGKQYLYRYLKRLGFDFQPTHANFILMNTNRSLKAVDDFMLQRGIIIRPMNLNGFANGYIRVSIGKPSANRSFIRALEELKKNIAEME